jgi:hypothetical protein
VTGGALAEAVMPLIAGMTATRTHLLEWVHTLGVGALQAVFTAEAEALRVGAVWFERQVPREPHPPLKMAFLETF